MAITIGNGLKKSETKTTSVKKAEVTKYQSSALEFIKINPEKVKVEERTT